MDSGKQAKDPEIEALAGAVELIDRIPKEARFRVVEYLNERYLESIPYQGPTKSQAQPQKPVRAAGSLVEISRKS